MRSIRIAATCIISFFAAFSAWEKYRGTAPNVSQLLCDPALIHAQSQSRSARSNLAERRVMVDKIRCKRFYAHSNLTCSTSLCKSLAQRVHSGEELRVIVGAGDTSFEGWVATDMDTVNLLDPGKLVTAFPLPATLTALLAEHVLEHFDVQEALAASEAAYCLLKPGGIFRVAVPETLMPVHTVSIYGYGGWGVKSQTISGYPGHHSAWDATSLSQLLQLAGFQTLPLEFWDTKGTFHSEPWDDSSGPITRSAARDFRNRNGSLVFTSLIVDAVKPMA